MIGERLAEIRKDHSDTQQDLADYLNVSLPTVRSWEQDKNSPSHILLVKICKHYNVSSDYLLGLTNYDPIYTDYIRKKTLSDEDYHLIKEFEDFVIWRRQKVLID